jgi:hypothetical protein
VALDVQCLRLLRTPPKNDRVYSFDTSGLELYLLTVNRRERVAYPGLRADLDEGWHLSVLQAREFSQRAIESAQHADEAENRGHASSPS